MIIVAMAKRGCHLKGIIEIPLRFNAPTVAVDSKRKRVRMPIYIIRGLPKISVKAILFIIIFIF